MRALGLPFFVRDFCKGFTPLVFAVQLFNFSAAAIFFPAPVPSLQP